MVAGQDKPPAGRLFDVARAQLSQDTLALALRGRPRQPARDVVLQLSWGPPLALRAPQRPGGATGKGAPVAAGVVRVWEARTDGTPGLEWLLLTDVPVTGLAQARADRPRAGDGGGCGQRRFFAGVGRARPPVLGRPHGGRAGVGVVPHTYGPAGCCW